MNFKWSHDIHNRDDYSTNESGKKASDDESSFFLPNFCKPIGLMIAFLPLAFKIKQLFFASAFHDPFQLPDRTLFFILMCGLFIEALSKPKIESMQAQAPRVAFIMVFAITTLLFYLPFIAHTVQQAWHWFF